MPRTQVKPAIAIVGPGRLASALAHQLKDAGYQIREIVSHENAASRGKAVKLAEALGARQSEVKSAVLDADLVWFCVPDGQIAVAARALAKQTQWKGKIAFHSSGALASDELKVLRKRGAFVAAVHPLMTFVHAATPSLRGVPFAVEGDASAIQVARRVVGDLGGDSFAISKKYKLAYHAWGAFASPLLIAALVAAEEVAAAAGIPAPLARKRMLPILTQTLANYAVFGPDAAFSGPIVRGDVETVRQHLKVLKKMPDAKEVYVALARIAIKRLPAENKKKLSRLLRH
jgi:predicted short-subunit dehydrogenase-like oxidoreductase (DUF2520 family)